VLSRIAESLFWIGRYVERVDGTARIVDVLRLQHVEDAVSTEGVGISAALRVVLGVDVGEDGEFADVCRRVAFDSQLPGSIASSWRDARENARRARETISLEHWEAVNMSWRGWSELSGREVTARHLAYARERTALIRGTADSTMSHDQAWQFLVLGRTLERTDMTARLVATAALPQLGAAWTTVLQAVGAQQSYLRSNRGVVTPERAATFLVLDRQFPRSVLFAIREAEQMLEHLDPASSRVGIPDEARRRLGEVRTGLEYRPVDQALTDLPGQMWRVQRAVTDAAEAVGAKYFPGGPPPTWVEERV
jgi:uncharacterized alpha-E superfamily protein